MINKCPKGLMPLGTRHETWNLGMTLSPQTVHYFLSNNEQFAQKLWDCQLLSSTSTSMPASEHVSMPTCHCQHATIVSMPPIQHGTEHLSTWCHWWGKRWTPSECRENLTWYKEWRWNQGELNTPRRVNLCYYHTHTHHDDRHLIMMASLMVPFIHSM